MVLIEAQDIEKVYGVEGVKTPALRGVSLSVENGEFVAIMGPSGSGKSTLMHILGLLDRASAGTYKFNGRDVSKLTDTELALLRSQEIGFVFQAFNLLPRTTVLDNVKLPLAYSDKRGDYNKMATRALENVGLLHRINHLSNQISGGEKQRVAIARALINNPSVIFADEPTGNLDSKSGHQIMELMRKLNNDGNTIILVTHEPEIAEYCKRIVHIKDGVIEHDEKVKQRTAA